MLEIDYRLPLPGLPRARFETDVLFRGGRLLVEVRGPGGALLLSQPRRIDRSGRRAPNAGSLQQTQIRFPLPQGSRHRLLMQNGRVCAGGR